MFRTMFSNETLFSTNSVLPQNAVQSKYTVRRA